jgi:hypothetical protein
MQPIFPIESLTVPVDVQSTQTVSGFPTPSTGFALPTGIEWVQPQVLAADVRAIAETQTLGNIGAAAYTLGEQAWYRRTAEPHGLLTLTTAQASGFAGAEHLYFASKIKKHLATRAYYGHKSYTVQRILIHKQPLTTWRFNLFDESVQNAWNAAGGYASMMDVTGFNLMELTLNGQQEGPVNEPYEMTWHPLFTEAPAVLGTQTLATLGPSPQKWLRMGHLETVVDGNTVNVTGQINAILTDPDQRARARQFAVPQDWTTQKRDFDTAVLRQAAIPALNCVPLPSFEVNVPGSIFENGYRKGFEAVGDLALMAWQPVEDDDSSVWILNRIRLPQPINLPRLTLETMGMPAWMQGDILFETQSSTAPIASLNPNKTIGMPCFVGGVSEQFTGWDGGGIAGLGSYQSRYTKSGNYVEFTNERDQSTHAFNGVFPGENYRATVPQAEVTAAIASGQIVARTPSALGDFACIGLTSEQAAANAPTVLYWAGGEVAKMFEIGTQDVAVVGQYTVQSVRVTETGQFQTVYKDGTGSEGLGAQIEDQLEQVTTWANDFYCDPAKYVQVGVYEWRDSNNNVLHSQPLFAHGDLVDSFSVTIQFNAWDG